MASTKAPICAGMLFASSAVSSMARIMCSLSGYCSLLALMCLMQTSSAHSNVRDIASAAIPCSHSSFPAIVFAASFIGPLIPGCRQGIHARPATVSGNDEPLS